MLKIIKSEEFEPEMLLKETDADSKLTETVSAIISDVKKRGDEAVHEYTQKFDNCKITCFELEKPAIEKSVNSVDIDFLKLIERTAVSIEDYHRNQVSTGFDLLPKNGIILGQKVTPLARVGCYIPGGNAPLTSSVLMNCIPAKLAGVKELSIATPPSQNSKHPDECNGVNPCILAAAKIAGVDKVFTIGGAQAIAAMAYGTQTVPRVDKITGPGNAYVTEAKRQVYGVVGIDMLAGPSDILIIADKHTNPEIIAADMLSQCEHGCDSSAILVTDSASLAKKVRTAIKLQLETLPRKETAKKAIDENSLIIIASTLEDVFTISNKIAPEHLEILLDEPFDYLNKIFNAGSIFLGAHTPVTFGDYIAGPNHVLPTRGTARFSNPLTVDDFVKKSSYTYFMKEALIEKSKDAIRFAKEENLDAHAMAVEKRLKDYA